MDGKRFQHGGFSFKIEKADNESLIASITHHERVRVEDNAGALYYVVVVILIYGCSILMMIASYIRKNKVDQRLNRYFKDMATVRKREEQLQIFNAATVAAALQHGSRSDRISTDLSPSPSQRSSQGDRETPTMPHKSFEMKEVASTPRTNLHVPSPLSMHGRQFSKSPTLDITLEQRQRKSNVRFVNEQTDVDSDNDVFVSPDPSSSKSPKHLSPFMSPFLSPRRQLMQPDDSDNDTLTGLAPRSHQSSLTDADQQSIDVDQASQVAALLPRRPSTALEGQQKDYHQVVSTV